MPKTKDDRHRTVPRLCVVEKIVSETSAYPLHAFKSFQGVSTHQNDFVISQIDFPLRNVFTNTFSTKVLYQVIIIIIKI